MDKRIVDAAVTRRRLLSGVGAAAAYGMVGTAAARAPLLQTQAPAYYRFKLGAFECTVVSDGPLPLGDPSGIFVGIGKDEMGRVLSDNFLPPDHVTVEQNALVVNAGDRLVLIDTGMGPSKMFGGVAGRLVSNLKLAGLEPKSIDAVVISHAHIDHCNGLMDANGGRNFPNAQIYMHQADYDFWTDEGKLGSPLKDLIAAARANLVPNRERIVFFADGQEFLPGIQALHAPGHTVGHTALMITSQGKSACNTADVAHHPVLSVEHPRVEFAYDTDRQQAVSTRLRMLDMLAATRTPLLAYHFSWPGLGHVARRGDSYRYVASPLQMAL